MNRTESLRKRAIVVRRQRIACVVITVFMIVFSSIFILSDAKTVKASNQNKKYFTSIQVEDGDTLWSIAEEYMTDEYASTASYIAEVKKMNNISSDQITSGCYLLVPYYAEEPLQ